jgi:hypothetical protein
MDSRGSVQQRQKREFTYGKIDFGRVTAYTTAYSPIYFKPERCV